MEAVTYKERSKRKSEEDLLAMAPADLLELALEDVRAAEEAEDLCVDMGMWVKPGERIAFYDAVSIKQRREPCKVCMAGAVLVMEMGWPAWHIMSSLSWVSAGTKNILTALDTIRCGYIDTFLWRLGYRWNGPDYVFVPPYQNDVSGWHEQMQVILHELRRPHYTIERVR